MSIRIGFELMLVVSLTVALFGWWRSCRGQKFDSFNSFSEGAFHALAAVGILLAGVWVLVRQDWAPNTAVSVATNVAPLPGSTPKAAVLQVAVNLKNDGRVPEEFEGVTVLARSYKHAPAVPTQKGGDLAITEIGHYTDASNIRIMPGESDVTYAELRIPCNEDLVQIFVSASEPRHLEWISGPSRRYERKIMRSIAEVCPT
jgi:hypothetical protein